MPSPAALPAEALEALARGRTILTSNQRAARTLRRAYDLHQQAAGLQAWQPPALFAWETWLDLLWNRLILNGKATALLLNRSQEQTLWQQIIRTDPEAAATHTLRPVDSLAELAARAWTLLHAHRARRSLTEFSDTADTRAFARWAAEFDRRCARADYLSAARLPEVLAEAFAANDLPLGESGLLLIGFDARTPAQTALLEVIAKTGTAVETLAAPAFEATTRTLVSAPSEYDELALCARWIRTHLTATPEARIAVIVPALEAERSAIDRTFRHILAPELDDITASASSGPFEFSLGVPLAQTSAVAAALDLLAWTAAPLPLDRVSALLLSPHVAGGSERIARAEFDAFTVRREQLLEPELAIGTISSLIWRSPLRENLMQLDRHLKTLNPFLNLEPSAQQSHADWAATFARILHAAGWAETASIGSLEFQLRRRWESALDELASLDFDGRRIAFADALAALHRIATQTLFAPESRNAPVQIMGPLEAAGSTFDALWFLRAGDLSWPAAASPNPLLPWRLQRELAMPGANPAIDADLARRITERLAASAPTVVVSYAIETLDSLQRPSPTLSGLVLDPCAAEDVAPPEPAAAPILLDTLADDAPISPPPDRVLQGGSAILGAQAACAFRAFAEKRLFSGTPDSPELGLDAAERGNLVHNALEAFWREVETHAALKLLTPVERDGLLLDAIDSALQSSRANAAPGWSAAYLDTERQRLLNLLGPWLDHEAERNPFEVRDREYKISDVAIGPLRIDLRIDRIDTHLINGQPAGEILLDYKTGTVKPADWLGNRPDDPQVPLYAIVGAANPLAAVAFANVRPGKFMGISGYESEKGILRKASRLKTDSLEAQVAEWRTVLESLASAFYAGESSVAPKQYPSTCRNCEQRILCRLDPPSLEPELLEDLDEPTSESEGEFA